MKIEVLFTEGCQSYQKTMDLIRQVVSDLRLEVEVRLVQIKNSEDVEQHRFFGSPTVRVNDADIDLAVRSRSDYGFG